MDTLFAAMGCSMSGITIPKRCALLVSAVGTAFLGVSLFCSGLLTRYLPPAVSRYGGCIVLLAMGTAQLCKGLFHAYFERKKRMCLYWKGIGIVIQICLDETKADTDGSKSLSLRESAAFSAALSLDSLASGLGAGISQACILPCLLLTFLLGFAVTVSGSCLGRVCRKHHSCSWAGAILLILLGLSRLL